MRTTSKPLATLALMGIALGSLVACGGGSSTPAASVAAPTTVTVTAPQTTPSTGNTSTGISQTGSLQYLVYDNTSPTTGLGTTAVGAVNSTARTITFPSAPPFAGGLAIGGLTTASITFNSTPEVGGASDSGNVFLFCSAGKSTAAAGEAVARAGVRLGFSGNAVALTNVAFLYGKTVSETNCTNVPSTWTFGDGNGNLTLSTKEFGGSVGIAMTAAQLTAAFSAAGFTLTTGNAAGANVKFRAYSSVESGVTKYLVATLVTATAIGGTNFTSLLLVP